ncbi:hypothetical protein E2R51_03015 [Jeotgalibacillus sp. S-D1]|uniref:helix-turn-helix domain-containing protein n=1 Tax=Jeotgalibacillus sp. S-D1 TaxID=2552189 RepID=UPI0010597B76|nr:helix-turn-helix domain-containing protein [Jeotgalibacillus sp. S-D1]TDL34705.1 hypothetical protein E2R51_03015 [Jeotgalibacillus sp. S-D1]
MTYLDAILLTCFRLFNGDRSRSAIYHLLTGKKTSQTIQDAHLYGVSNLFQTLPALSRFDFDSSCQKLMDDKLIFIIENNRYKVTSEGENQLEAYYEKHFFPLHVQGWNYQDRAMVFWKRLSLLVQTLSNIYHNERYFYPVQRDPEIQYWVRGIFLTWGDRRNKKIKSLHSELMQLCQCSGFPDRPDFFIHRLSGYRLIGMTTDQLAKHFKMDAAEAHFRFLNIVHFSINHIQENPVSYPLLNSVIEGIAQEKVILTSSTEKTKEYVSRGFSLSDIAAARKLKESTIEDHIIELALMTPSFAIDRYVNESLQEMIWSQALNLNHKRLREIKIHVPEASYFQIRLVLVTRGRGDGKWKDYSSKNLALNHSEKAKGK